MKKIVIFGSTGNIGAYFTDYCNNMIDKKQYEVIAVGRKHTDYYRKAGIEYINVDLCNASAFERLPTEDLYVYRNLFIDSTCYVSLHYFILLIYLHPTLDFLWI